MATSFPGGLDSYTDPTGTDRLDTVDHAGQHTDINDSMEAVQAKVGADSSAVTTSHDYKLSNVTGSDKAASVTGTETLTNKTLTDPIINVAGTDATGDIYYRNLSGTFTRLAIGSNTDILSVSASGIPEWITNPDTSDASTTTKGIVELATQSEYDARTATGGTGAKLVPTPDIVRGILYHDYAASSSGNDTYAITVTPAPAAYTTGDVYVFEPDTVNTGAATLNVNSLGAKTIVRPDGSTLEDGDIQAGGIHTVVYDGTSMILQNPFNLNKLAVNCGFATQIMTSLTTFTIAHGLGKTPRLVKFNAVIDDSTGANPTYGMAAGVATTTSNQMGVYGGDDPDACQGQNDAVLEWYSATGSSNAKIDVNALDATNITLEILDTSNGYVDIIWEAYA